LRARFAREVRFGVKTTPSRWQETSELELLKQRLLQQLLEETMDAEENLLLRRAANDAAALAWSTAHPVLLFPELFREKAQAARLQRERQGRIRRRSRILLEEAA